MDKVIENLIAKETKRQQETIDLIPSENYASQEVLRVLGSPLTNKYSEGYPAKRYYSGNEYYDQIEILAQERALKAFKLDSKTWSANVQPYSGSPANFAIYGALMKPGDTLMGMNLPSGGHLTHGHKVSFTGKFFNSVQYGVDEKTGLLNYGGIERLAKQYKPKVIVSGLSSYPKKIDFKKFGEIAKSVGAYHVADISHVAGLVLAGLYPSPFPHSDVVMTTSHKTLRGPRGGIIFSKKALAEQIDKAVFPGMQGGPHNNAIAAKAVMLFEAMRPDFKKYQSQVIKNSQAFAEALKNAGFDLLTGGTDNHLLLIDLKRTGLDGKIAESLLEKNNINGNRNAIPGDTSPFKPSGLRLGTPAVTTRGMKEKEMKKIAELIHRALIKKEVVKKEVVSLCKKFPLSY